MPNSTAAQNAVGVLGCPVGRGFHESLGFRFPPATCKRLKGIGEGGFINDTQTLQTHQERRRAYTVHVLELNEF